MKIYAKSFLFAVIALCAVHATPVRAETGPVKTTFFTPEEDRGLDANNNRVFYLSYFDIYTRVPDGSPYIYKYDFGFLYYFGTDGPSDNTDAYFYDFTAGDVLYTTPGLYPYFYSFNLDSFLYYLEGSQPRTFYEFNTDSYITY